MNFKTLTATDSGNWAALITRLTIGIVIFPHGAQKLLGWYGGYGFAGTMNFLTQTMHLPWLLGVLVILTECIGSLAIITGFLTRFFSIAMLINFLGIIYTSHIHNGFFMNWASRANTPEGFEYHLLVLGLCIATIITGGGKLSLDSAFFNKKP